MMNIEKYADGITTFKDPVIHLSLSYPAPCTQNQKHSLIPHFLPPSSCRLITGLPSSDIIRKKKYSSVVP